MLNRVFEWLNLQDGLMNEPPQMDKKAKNILFKTYWTSAGWVNDLERKTDPVDFEYAKLKGLMFDDLTISKSELLERLSKALNNISLRKVTDAFLSSLTSGRCDWRSGLASYVNAHRIINGENVDEYNFGYGANVDLNVLNFERIKWGGIRLFQALYNMLDLELLSREVIPQPSEEDIRLFRAVLHKIENSDPSETASKLRDNLKEVINISKPERHVLQEILGCAKIILALSHDRKEPGKHDWRFLVHWRGEDKYSKTNCGYYFGSYGID